MNFICNLLKGNFFPKVLSAFSLLFLSGCYSTQAGSDQISSINIIDRNGMNETISERDRLENFQKTNFLAPQPYQKVLRVFGREENGDVRATITSYHPNGQVKQYLEAINNRAFGQYTEWHPNGHVKIEGKIIGGLADINTQAEESWLFDGINRAWDDDGHLIAEIAYQKGELEGESKYYHTNGKLWKALPFEKNVPHGTQKIFLADGSLLQTMEYLQGVREGVSMRYWSKDTVAYEELYEKGGLLEARYLDATGALVSEIHGGTGVRAIFGKERLQELQGFSQGKQEGLVKFYDDRGNLYSTYSINNCEKNGEEINYYSSGEPKLSMMWKDGMLHGIVKTWYDNGSIESQREMSKNQKNGHFTSWYRNGSLMFVEEYDNDKLVKGEYYRSGEKMPLSKIERGQGVATLFDAEGTSSRKVMYNEGKPIE